MSCVEISNAVFEQFISLVGDITKKLHHSFNRCDYSYKVVLKDNSRQMTVEYEAENACGKCQQIYTCIDFTNICFKELHCEKWIKYLKRIAELFVRNIYQKSYVVEQKYIKCRDKIPDYVPKPCKITKTIIETEKPCKDEEEIIVYKAYCPCESKCVAVPCKPVKETIIQYVTAPPKCCEATYKPIATKYRIVNGCQDFNDIQFDVQDVSKCKC